MMNMGEYYDCCFDSYGVRRMKVGLCNGENLIDDKIGCSFANNDFLHFIFLSDDLLIVCIPLFSKLMLMSSVILIIYIDYGDNSDKP